MSFSFDGICLGTTLELIEVQTDCCKESRQPRHYSCADCGAICHGYLHPLKEKLSDDSILYGNLTNAGQFLD